MKNIIFSLILMISTKTVPSMLVKFSKLNKDLKMKEEWLNVQITELPTAHVHSLSIHVSVLKPVLMLWLTLKLMSNLTILMGMVRSLTSI
jgi:hypothetical protein